MKKLFLTIFTSFLVLTSCSNLNENLSNQSEYSYFKPTVYFSSSDYGAFFNAYYEDNVMDVKWISDWDEYTTEERLKILETARRGEMFPSSLRLDDDYVYYCHAVMVKNGKVIEAISTIKYLEVLKVYLNEITVGSYTFKHYYENDEYYKFTTGEVKIGEESQVFNTKLRYNDFINKMCENDEELDDIMMLVEDKIRPFTQWRK